MNAKEVFQPRTDADLQDRRQRGRRTKHRVAWPLRNVTWLVAASQIMGPYGGALCALADGVSQADWSSSTAGEPPAHHARAATPEIVAVNRTVPHVEPPA